MRIRVMKIEEDMKPGDKQTPIYHCYDSCDRCERKEKPIYRCYNTELDIDTVLCPKCLERFKKAVADIEIN